MKEAARVHEGEERRLFGDAHRECGSSLDESIEAHGIDRRHVPNQPHCLPFPNCLCQTVDGIARPFDDELDEPRMLMRRELRKIMGVAHALALRQHDRAREPLDDMDAKVERVFIW